MDSGTKGTMKAVSMHTGTFPPETTDEAEAATAPAAVPPPHRRSLWRQGADSIRDTVQRRLSQTRMASGKDEPDQIESLVTALSPSEQETAARTDYRYLLAPHNDALREKSIRMAVQRVLRSKDHSSMRTLAALQATLAFRQKLDVDALRLTFSGQDAPDRGRDEPLYRHLSRGMVYVQGYDRQGRSTYVFEPRRVTNAPDELDWTIRMHVYTLERAIACSRCPDRTVNAVVNFCDFSLRRHKPPLEVGAEFMQTLRQHYSGYVHQIFLVDAPRTFFYLWAVFAPFLAAKTKRKIHFVSGDRQKRSIIGELYDLDQAAPWMLPGGRLEAAWDPQQYLLGTAFDTSHGESASTT